MIYPLFTVQMLWPLYVFSNILDFIKAEKSTYQNVHYFIRSKNCVLHILCTTAMKQYYARSLKVTFHHFRVTCFSAYRSSWKQRNLPRSSSDLNLVNFLLRRVLQQKMYQQDSQYIDHSHMCSVTLPSLICQDATEGAPNQLVQRAVFMVHMVHSGHVEFLLTYGCS